MDPTTPVNVAKGAAVTSVATGSFVALNAILRGSPHPGPLALSAATNGGIAGAIFFGIREVVVTPVLHATLRRSELSPGSSSHAGPSSQPSWSQLRTHRLLDSAASGALTGAIINKWRNGQVVAGARTVALLCTLLQLGYNELGVMRIKYVTRKMQETRAQSEPVRVPSPTARTDDTPKLSIFDRLLGIIGFRKLTDDEYLKVLKKQRDEALQRIAVLEMERKEKEQARQSVEELPDSGKA